MVRGISKGLLELSERLLEASGCTCSLDPLPNLLAQAVAPVEKSLPVAQFSLPVVVVRIGELLASDVCASLLTVSIRMSFRDPRLSALRARGSLPF